MIETVKSIRNLPTSGSVATPEVARPNSGFASYRKGTPPCAIRTSPDGNCWSPVPRRARRRSRPEVSPSSFAKPDNARYSWRNAEMVGGGFVPGIVFNQAEPGLVYARTDIGGAYRLDKVSGRWVPLLDWVGWDQWGWTGVASLATDAVDPDRLYLAVGTYTNDWDPNNGAILRSRDRGRSFKVSPLPFKVGGNMPGRGMGERLAIDPNRNSILYLGAPSGHGLWRSGDSGAHLVQSGQFSQPGHLPARSQRHQRIPQRPDRRGVGGLRPAHRFTAAAHPQHLCRRGGQGQSALPQR